MKLLRSLAALLCLLPAVAWAGGANLPPVAAPFKFTSPQAVGTQILTLSHSADPNRFAKLGIDPTAGFRVETNIAGNSMTVWNRSTAQYAEASIIFRDNTAAYSGNGAEHFAIGYDLNGNNGVFSNSNFIETSNDPAAGATTNAPTPLRIIQTGYVNGSYASRIRQEWASDGTWNVYDVAGSKQITLNPAAPYNIGIGQTAPNSNAKLDINGSLLVEQNLGVGTIGSGLAVDILSGTPQLRLKGTGTTSEMRINAAYGNANLGAFGTVSASPFMFYTNNTEALRIDAGQNVQFSSPSIAANGTVATSLTSVGPTGANTTPQEWLKVKNASGVVRYIPMF